MRSDAELRGAWDRGIAEMRGGFQAGLVRGCRNGHMSAIIFGCKAVLGMREHLTFDFPALMSFLREKAQTDPRGLKQLANADGQEVVDVEH